MAAAAAPGGGRASAASGAGSFALLLACFFLSGLAALVYQTAWTRQFSFVFGTSELAVATVLAAYMGGLSLGAAVAGRLAPRVRRPVLAYGVLEGAIALAALAVPAGIAGVRRLHTFWFATGGEIPEAGGLASALFYLAGTFAVLALPTALMGATLPLLARHAVRSEAEIGPRIGWLYTANTVGAVAGVAAAGFWLLPALGLSRTVWVAVGANAAVFGAAAALARSAPIVEPVVSTTTRPVRDAASMHGWILPVIAVSGAVSFSYEVLWTRLLTHVTGGSVYAFATMLATFLAGIAIGSAVASRRARDRRRALADFAIAQAATALMSLVAFYAIDQAPDWMRWLRETERDRLLANALVAGVVLLPSTVCIGATFPLAVRILAAHESDASPASARVYSWNTVGSIVGAIGAGYWWIPALGFAATLTLGVTLNLVLAAVAAWRSGEPRPRLAGGLALATLFSVAVAPPEPPWRLLQTSPLLLAPPSAEPPIHYAVGRSATVVVREGRGAYHLATNGLPESVVQPPGGRAARFGNTQWMAALPTLARPDAERILVVGLGGGVAVERVPPSIERIDVIELEPEVVEANRFLSPRRRDDPLADPRLRLIVNDARGALALTGDRYDGIVSQPSHPWTAGSSHLYTREFFELARAHLREDGLLVQWMGLAFVDPELLRILVATLLDVFPHVEVYEPSPGGVLLVASPSPLAIPDTVERALAESPAHFRRMGIFTAEDVVAVRRLDTAGAGAFAAGARINRDDRNWLQMRSPAIVRQGIGRRDWDAEFAPYDALVTSELPWKRVRLVQRLIATGFMPRARRVAEAAPAAERDLAMGILAVAAGRPGAGRARLQRVLARSPGQPDALATLLTLSNAHQAGRPLQGRRPPGHFGAVWDAWKVQRQDPRRIRTHEAALAAVPFEHPMWAEATRLRAQWRIALGDPRLAEDALELLDAMLNRAGTLQDLLLRGSANASARQWRAALSTLLELAGRLRAEPQHRWLARDALALLGRVPRGIVDPILRRDLEQRLARVARAQPRRRPGPRRG